MRLKGWRGAVASTLVSAACAGAAGAQQASEPPAAELPAVKAPGKPSQQVPVTASQAPADKPAVPVGPAADVLREIAAGCMEKRYADVGELLHPTLRRTWLEIDYKVKDFCELITRDYTLTSVTVESEARAGAYAVVYVTFAYADGSKLEDRSTFLPQNGAWRLTGS